MIGKVQCFNGVAGGQFIQSALAQFLGQNGNGGAANGFQNTVRALIKIVAQQHVQPETEADQQQGQHADMPQRQACAYGTKHGTRVFRASHDCKALVERSPVECGQCCCEWRCRSVFCWRELPQRALPRPSNMCGSPWDRSPATWFICRWIWLAP